MPRTALVALIALAYLLAGAPRAVASFTVAGSAGTSAGQSICELQAGGGAVSALVCDPAGSLSKHWRVSLDGVTWTDETPVGMTEIDALAGGAGLAVYGRIGSGVGFAAYAPGVAAPTAIALHGPDLYLAVTAGIPGPDGSQRMLVLTAGGPQLVTADATGAVTAAIAIPAELQADRKLMLGSDGTLWLTGSAPAGWAQVGPDGSITAVPGGPVWSSSGANALRATGVWLGATLSSHATYLPVPGAPGLLASGGTLIRNSAPDLWSPYWQQPPEIVDRVVSDGTRLYAAATGAWETSLGTDQTVIWSAPLETAVPAAIGTISPAAAAMVGAANAVRAGMGLPPLIADETIGRAAENHSHYWTVNPQVQGLGLHDETAGKPGFTGRNMAERCDAVGASCNSEIMYGGLAPADAVTGWLATAFHRPLLADPTAVLVGGGRVGNGPDVMDADSRSGVLLAPRGMPSGTWSGPLSFSGEYPDPAEECASAHQPKISAPYGTAVTVWAPTGGTATSVSLARVQDGKTLAGCSLGNVFTPDDALDPSTAYQATAQWTVGDIPQTPIVWRFTTAAATRSGSRRSPGVRIASRAHKVHGHWRVTISGAAAVGRRATVRMRRYTRRCAKCALKPTGKTTIRHIKLTRSLQLALPTKAKHHAAGWRVSVSLPAFDGYIPTSLTAYVR